MPKKIIFSLIVTLVVVLVIYWFYPNKKETGCLLSGGKISASLCCQLTNDFPNSCSIGACGCSPTHSRQVKTCDCGEGKCFNGNICVTIK